MARSDMFLKLETSRAGLIKGESVDPDHKEEIDVIAWSWGMRAKTSMGSGGSVSKATLRDIKIRKRVDHASTALMSAARNNDLVKSAALSVRKAGAPAIEYLAIKLEKGRITAVDVESSGDEAPELLESIEMSFQKITVEYRPQGSEGGKRGATQFEAEVEAEA